MAFRSGDRDKGTAAVFLVRSLRSPCLAWGRVCLLVSVRCVVELEVELETDFVMELCGERLGTTIQAQVVGNSALLPRPDFERLLEIARRSEEIHLQLEADDLPTAGIMRLAEAGGSLDFWQDPAENIYSATDGEPVR